MTSLYEILMLILGIAKFFVFAHFILRLILPLMRADKCIGVAQQDHQGSIDILYRAFDAITCAFFGWDGFIGRTFFVDERWEHKEGLFVECLTEAQVVFDEKHSRGIKQNFLLVLA